MTDKTITTRCCIVGGGPAGIMTGFLLARSGIHVTVLEQWPDFFRDFRGDTIHPATLDLLGELNILDAFLQLPINKTVQIGGEIGGQRVTLADFSYLKTKCPYIAFIPQWDFLNFMVEEARHYPSFHLLMHTEAVDLIQEEDRCVGVIAKKDDALFEIRADLVIGADGRHSMVRKKSHLPVETLGAPMDVLWFRLPRLETDETFSLGKINEGRMLVMINRDTYWQCGFLIRKGTYDYVQKSGLALFHQSLLDVSPSLKDRVNTLVSWDQIKLLTVTVDYLTQWYRAGLLCIGDAAHAMSPIGGVGINLAIQDAVAAANRLVPAFQANDLTEATLRAIQKRRQFPTRCTQRMQLFLQDRIIDRVLGNKTHPKLPLFFKLLNSIPVLRWFPAYLIGMGFRREHIKTQKNSLTGQSR
ncbi:MAG TPA: FAD-dependent oxidoreductase [Gammaproteobacteria bacterium]|nr:FAD-dependent oxidoreductase [Gammaproteobacteria bacterium]